MKWNRCLDVMPGQWCDAGMYSARKVMFLVSYKHADKDNIAVAYLISGKFVIEGECLEHKQDCSKNYVFTHWMQIVNP